MAKRLSPSQPGSGSTPALPDATPGHFANTHAGKFGRKAKNGSDDIGKSSISVVISAMVQFQLLRGSRQARPAAHDGSAASGDSGLIPVTALLNAHEVIKTFGSFGWHMSRQNGSHIVLVKEGASATLLVSIRSLSHPEHCGV